MSTSTRALNTDPLRSFKFNVVIPQKVISQTSGTVVNSARLGFMSMQGLGISVEPLTYREGGDNLTTRKMPGQADFGAVTLSRGLFATDDHNWSWMTNIFTAVYGGGTEPQPNQANGSARHYNFRTNIYINILEHPNNTGGSIGAGGYYQGSYPNQNLIVKVSFKLYSAWMSALAYSDLDAGGNAVGIEQMQLSYEGFDMKWGGSGYVANPTTW